MTHRDPRLAEVLGRLPEPDRTLIEQHLGPKKHRGGDAHAEMREARNRLLREAGAQFADLGLPGATDQLVTKFRRDRQFRLQILATSPGGKLPGRRQLCSILKQQNNIL